MRIRQFKPGQTWKKPAHKNLSKANQNWAIFSSKSSVIRQKGDYQNGCFKKTKHAKFYEKRTFFTPWYLWRALFSWRTGFEIHPFVLLLTNWAIFSSKRYRLCSIDKTTSYKHMALSGCHSKINFQLSVVWTLAHFSHNLSLYNTFF